jgi:hypothetical protein
MLITTEVVITQTFLQIFPRKTLTWPLFPFYMETSSVTMTGLKGSISSTNYIDQRSTA